MTNPFADTLGLGDNTELLEKVRAGLREKFDTVNEKFDSDPTPSMPELLRGIALSLAALWEAVGVIENRPTDGFASLSYPAKETMAIIREEFYRAVNGTGGDT